MKKILALVLVLAIVGVVQALPVDMDFVGIGWVGNDAQSSANRDHTASGGDGYGAVEYAYSIGKTAVSVANWAAFYNDTNSGKVGSFNSDYNYWQSDAGVDAPVAYVNFHQAAQFTNWLTTGDATEGAYTINSSGLVTGIDRSYRNQDGKLYAVPTENEWFKAAYFDGENQKYNLYAHGEDTAPPKSTDGETGWNYDDAVGTPWAVDKGTAEQNGTLNMMGNVWEWLEDLDGTDRLYRGGRYAEFGLNYMESSARFARADIEHQVIGFRIVEIPEPMTLALLGLGGLFIRRRRA